jgi:hypothetical protein
VADALRFGVSPATSQYSPQSFPAQRTRRKPACGAGPLRSGIRPIQHSCLSGDRITGPQRTEVAVRDRGYSVRLEVGESNVELLCSSFGVDFRDSGNHAPREDNQSMVSRDWAAQDTHESIVGLALSFLPSSHFGGRANWLRRLPTKCNFVPGVTSGIGTVRVTFQLYC